jgi:Flp pilus assembly protein TadD
MLVQERGIDFEPTDDYLQEVRLAGGEDELISALKSAKVTKPATVDPAGRRRGTWRASGEGQCRLRNFRRSGTMPRRPAREALRLNPNNDNAHVNLGIALGQKGDLDGEIAEEREALRLNPKNE